MGNRLARILISLWIGLFAAACGRGPNGAGFGAFGAGYNGQGQGGSPQVDESGFEQARRLGPSSSGAGEAPAPAAGGPTPVSPTSGPGVSLSARDLNAKVPAEKSTSANGATRLQINEVLNLRFEKAGRLEFLAELPPGSVIEVPAHYSIVALPFRDSHGGYRTSSTGFLTPVRVVSVPKSAGMTDAQLAAQNQTPGGLYVFASILGNVEGVSGNFPALKAEPASASYLKNFEASGRPVLDFEKRLEKKFGGRLGHASVGMTDQATREKWKRVYTELVRVANREVATPRSLLMITSAEAQKWSKELEQTGTAPTNGAWTIAVTATAPRHGFTNVPCAEFASEVIREAYVRSGVKLNDDFNRARKNELIWYGTADVAGLTHALVRAGWVPWSTYRHQPPVGAIMMNGTGESPGHAFIAAGHRGRFIIDNGSPQGRDLGLTRAHSLENMYSAAVFFLPPGIQPARW